MSFARLTTLFFVVVAIIYILMKWGEGKASSPDGFVNPPDWQQNGFRLWNP